MSVLRFPVTTERNVLNGDGLTYRYQVRKLTNHGPARAITEFPRFGHHMKVEWGPPHPDQAYISGIGYLNLEYLVSGSNVTFLVRLFDPPDALLDPDATCYNSRTCWQNYNDIVKEGANDYNANSRFNTTEIFTGGDCTTVDGIGCLWVCWMGSSTSCRDTGQSHSGDLKVVGSGACSTSAALDADTCGMVTDEFSEVGISVCFANSSAEPYAVAFMNSVDMLGGIMTTYGDLPSWSACKDGSTVTDTGGQDSAVDATRRIAYALYGCSINTNFTAGNRTRARVLASKLMNQSIQYEMVSSCQNTAHYGQICRWDFLGPDAAGFDGSPSEDMYIGYYADDLLALVAHAAHHRTNVTLKAIIHNITANALIAAHYDGGVLGTDLSHGHYRFYWNQTGGVIEPGVAPGYLSYWTGNAGDSGGSNTAGWDAADAVRFGFLCHVLTAYNQSYGTIDGVMLNLSDYCTAWSRHLTGFTSTASCRKYNSTFPTNDLCTDGPATGYKENGNFIGSHTWINRSYFDPKLDEIMGHYSWTTNTVDSTSCGNGLTYDTVRMTRAFIYGMALDEPMFSFNATGGGGGDGGGDTPAAVAGGINITLNNPGNGSNLTTASVTLNATVWNNNNSDVGNGTGFTYVVNETDTFITGAENWTGGAADTATATYNSTADFTTLSKNFNVSLAGAARVNLTLDGFAYQDDTNDPKLHVPGSNASGNDYLLFDGSKPGIQWKHVDDGGGFGECNTEIVGNVPWSDGDSVTITRNISSGEWCTYHTNSSGTKKCRCETSTINNGTDFAVTVEQSHLVSIRNATYSIWRDLGGGSTPGNSSMNVSFLLRDGTLLYQRNSTQNATAVSFNLTGLTSGNRSWYIEARSKDNVQNLTNLNFSVNLGGVQPGAWVYNGTQFHYRLDENSSNITDAAGFKNASESGTVNRLGTGILNKSHYTTAGSSGWVINATGWNYSAEFTVSFWINWTGDGDEQGTDVSLFKFTNSSNGVRAQLFHISTGVLRLQLGTDSGQNNYNTGVVNLDTERWELLVLRRVNLNGTHYCELYKNDTNLMNSSCTFGGVGSVATDSIIFACSSASPCTAATSNVIGHYDSINYWGKAISRDAITALYNSSAGVEFPITLTVDTIPPVIVQNAPANASVLSSRNITFNFTATDDISSALNCTLNLTNGTPQSYPVNATSGLSALRNVSFPADGQVNWSVNCSDGTNTNLSSTWIFTMNTSLTNASLNISVGNFTLELGTNVTFQVNVSPAVEVCVDIEHFQYRSNFTCGSAQLNVTFNVTRFQRTVFNSSLAALNLTINSTRNQSIAIQMHQYDRPSSLSFFLRGHQSNGTFPNVRVYVNGTLEATLGLVTNTSSANVTTFNDSIANKTVLFTSASFLTVGYFRLPKNATLTNARLTLASNGNRTLQETADSIVALSADKGKINVTYVKPAGATNNTKVSVKHDARALTVFNDTIPAACWNVNNTYLYLQIEAKRGTDGNSSSGLSCYNGTAFVHLSYTTVFNGYCSTCTLGVASIAETYDGNWNTNAFYSGFTDDWRSTSSTSGALLEGLFFEEAVEWDMYPSNFWLEVGAIDGTREFEKAGIFNTTNVTGNLSGPISSYLASCTADEGGNCNVPIYASSLGGSEVGTATCRSTPRAWVAA